MNPVFPIIVTKGTRAAAIGLVLQAVYTVVFRRNPPWPLTLGTATAIAAAVSIDLIVTFDAECRIGYPELVTHLHEGPVKRVALTFDDGPTPEHTPIILDLLNRADAKATFFLLGENVKRYPALVDAITEAGHAIALHGYKHEALANISQQKCAAEIGLAKFAVGNNALPYLRPPYGFKSKALQAACVQQNVKLTTWSINPKDYSTISPEQLVQRVTTSLHPGAIILLHENSPCTKVALLSMVDSIREKGYSFANMG